MLKMILENLIPIVFTIATPVVLVLARDLFTALAKKFHLDAAMAYEDKVQDLVTKGILAAEKASQNAVKAGKPKTPSEQKLKSVIDFVNTELAQHNLEQKAGDSLSKLVDATLSKLVTPPTAVPSALNG
jgi:hypothetical protein